MPVKTDRTVAWAADRWMEDVERRVDLGPATKALYALHIRKLVTWSGRTARLAKLDLCAYVIAEREAGYAPRTIALDVRIAKMMFRWARAEGLVRGDAALRAPRLRVEPKRLALNHRTPSPGEVARVLDAMPDDDWRLATLVMARTGARIGEVVGLRSCDVDVHEGRLALGSLQGASKTGLRHFPLDADTLEGLASRVGQGEAPLFRLEGRGNRGRRRVVVGAKQALQRRLYEACDAACVPRFSAQGLRRMVVCRLMRARIDAATAASLTGHSVEVMLKHYREVSDDDRRDAAEVAGLATLADPPRGRAA